VHRRGLPIRRLEIAVAPQAIEEVGRAPAKIVRVAADDIAQVGQSIDAGGEHEPAGPEQARRLGDSGPPLTDRQQVVERAEQ